LFENDKVGIYIVSVFVLQSGADALPWTGIMAKTTVRIAAGRVANFRNWNLRYMVIWQPP